MHVESALGIARAIRSPYAEFMARGRAQLPRWRPRGRGLRSLSAAMALGREHGCVNSQVWIPAVMARLCSRALEAGIEVDYVRALVVKRELVPESPPVDVEAWPWPIKIFTLGRFEVLLDGEPVRFCARSSANPWPAQGADRVRRSHRARGSRAGWALARVEGDAARAALATTLHRLRGLLGREQSVLRQEGQLSLDPGSAGWMSGRSSACSRAASRGQPGEFTGRRPTSTRERSSAIESSDSPRPRSPTAFAAACCGRSFAPRRQSRPTDPQQAVDWYEDVPAWMPATRTFTEA